MPRFSGTLRLLLAGLALALAAKAGEVTVRIAVAPGFKYDPPRFAVAPGDRVTVVFSNGDEMIHNFVLTAPGERLKVVSAALALGADGPGRNFVPDLKEVLWSTRALNPRETATLTFTAPMAEGIYPYVCTFPGHGFLMYGAMYVTRGVLPPLESDRNIPPAPAGAETREGLLKVGDKPVVSRTFLPDCGPAAVAVGLPGGQSCCFDAATCRLRYAWKGGFVDNTDQWAGKGDAWSKVVGRIYYRAPADRWLRLGSPDRVSDARWHGYRLVQGYPQMRYALDGAEVTELIRPRSEGDGLEILYEMPSAPGPVYFVIDEEGGATFTSSAGTWRGPVLALTAAEAARFTITLTERPRVEPLGYWSMNDALWSSRRVDPEPGVIGRAFTPGGLGGARHVLDSGIKVSELGGGATLAAWVKVRPSPVAGEKKPKMAETLAVFSAGADFIVASPVRDGRWHHLAVTLPAGGAPAHLYLDGSDQGPADLRLPAGDAALVIGSVGDRFLNGLLDEVRIYDRTLPAAEIRALYRREAIAGHLLTP